jgi:hypothetical protein
MQKSPENHREMRLENLVEFNLVQMVVNGSKPGCLAVLLTEDENDPITPEEYAQEIAKRYDLECIKADTVEGNKIIDNSEYGHYAIAKKRKVTDILAKAKLPKIPKIQDRVPKITDEIKNMTIAEALAYLGIVPRVDEEFAMVQEDNFEKPEVALMQGVLLGYKPCCIEHHIHTRYLRSPGDFEMEEKQYETEQYFGSQYHHGLCDDCINREYKKIQEEKRKAKGGIIQQIRNFFGKIF